MLQYIQEQIKALGCDTWELTEKTVTAGSSISSVTSWIRTAPPMSDHFHGKLYRLWRTGCRLLASGEIAPTASDAEIEKTLADIYFQASLVKNPAYRPE